MIEMCIPTKGIIVITGKNNTGKSRLLRKIHDAYKIPNLPEYEPPECKAISKQITSIIGTDIDMANIQYAPQSIKSFCFLKRLLDENLLSKETLVCIDSPDNDFHPQWAVEYAKILVRIHKEIGANFCIITMRPETVEALYDECKHEKLDKSLHYIIMTKSEDDTYVANYYMNNVSEVFNMLATDQDE